MEFFSASQLGLDILQLVDDRTGLPLVQLLQRKLPERRVVEFS